MELLVRRECEGQLADEPRIHQIEAVAELGQRINDRGRFPFASGLLIVRELLAPFVACNIPGGY